MDLAWYLSMLFATLQCVINILSVSGTLDIDELNNANYGIDILKEPVLFKPEEEIPNNHIHLTSKYGQRYRCYYPDQIEAERKTEKREKEALEIGIPELLKPLESGPCLLKARDWWSYEFCYGKYIRQFHVEDGKILGDVIYLGYFESEKDWSDQEKSNSRLIRYHSQTYINGSNCDLTGQHRKTEVRFICDEGAGDHIGRIDEPETCNYIMTIHTNKICHHPYLKPLKQSHAVPIICNPILGEDQYTEYQQMLQERKERQLKEEQKKKEEEEMNKISFKETEVTYEDKNSVIDENDLENNPEWKEGTGPKKSSLDSLKDAELKVKVQVIDNMDDLEKVFKDLKKMKNSLEKSSGDSKEIKEDEEQGGNEESQDKTTLHFKKNKVKERGKSVVSEVIDEIDKSDNILSQTDKDVEEMQNFDEDSSNEDILDDFDKGLEEIKFSNLKSRLQKNKVDLSELQSKVKDAMEDTLDDIIDEAETEVGANLEDRKKSYKHLTESLDNLIKKLDTTQEEIDKVDKHIEEASEDLSMAEKDNVDLKDKVLGPDKSTDDQVKVRVTRVNRKDLQKIEQPSEIENVEMQLKDELEKAGLDLAGGKVQVKIITAGYYDKKGEPIQTLSADDSNAFKDMIVSILGGDHEAAQEANKYEEQEDNYSFVWNDKQKKT